MNENMIKENAYRQLEYWMNYHQQQQPYHDLIQQQEIENLLLPPPHVSPPSVRMAKNNPVISIPKRVYSRIHVEGSTIGITNMDTMSGGSVTIDNNSNNQPVNTVIRMDPNSQKAQHLQGSHNVPEMHAPPKIKIIKIIIMRPHVNRFYQQLHQGPIVGPEQPDPKIQALPHRQNIPCIGQMGLSTTTWGYSFSGNVSGNGVNVGAINPHCEVASLQQRSPMIETMQVEQINGVPINTQNIFGNQHALHQATEKQVFTDNIKSGRSFFNDQGCLERLRTQLVLLMHANNCRLRKRSADGEFRECTKPGCKRFSELLIHMKTDCNDYQECPVFNCSSSKKLIEHWQCCKMINCPVCSVVNNRH